MRMLDWGEIQQTGLLRPAGLYSTKWKRDILKNNPRRKSTLGFSQWPEAAAAADDDAQVSPVGGGAAQGRGTCARHERVKGKRKKKKKKDMIADLFTAPLY